MKKRIQIHIFLFYFVILVCTGLFALQFTTYQKAPEFTLDTTKKFDKTLIVVADKDFSPYSYLDQDGNPTGYDIELISMVAESLGMNVEIQLKQWKDGAGAVKNKEADLILGLVYAPMEMHHFLLSPPTSSDAFSIFGKNYHGLKSLYNKKIAILAGSNIVPLFLEPYGLGGNITEYSTYNEAFESVQNGLNDYVIATHTVGRRFLAEYPEIKAQGSSLVSNFFCIAANTDQTDLMLRISEIIQSKKASGELASLAEKWFGHYVQIINFSDFVEYYKIPVNFFFLFALLVPLLYLVYVYRYRSLSFKSIESDLIARASRDSLTGLFNRSTTEAMIGQILCKRREDDLVHALFMIDLDDFKGINDHFGHAIGDEVLLFVAKNLRNAFRGSDIVARMGGDEFVVFMEDAKSIDAIEQRARVACYLLNTQINLHKDDIKIGASIGIALGKRGSNFIDLYKNADKALYGAKKKGKGQYLIYDGKDTLV